jgi:hypothetical protein
VGQTQNPPAFFYVSGGIGNGDQFDPGFPYNFTTSAGGGSKTRIVPNTNGWGQPYTTGWGTVSVSASIGAASMSATFQGAMDPVNASVVCNQFYGCGWSPTAGTGPYSSISVYVRGNPGTRYNLTENASGNLAASITQIQGGTVGLAEAGWSGISSADAKTSGFDIGSATASVSENHPISNGTSTTPTIQYNGQTYSYAFGMVTNFGLGIYANPGYGFTAHMGGAVTVNIAVNLVNPNQQPPTAVIDPIGPASVNVPVTLNGSNSHANTSGASLIAWNWTIKKSDGTVLATPSGQTVANFVFPAADTYNVALTVTDSDGLTGTDSTSVSVGQTSCKGVPKLIGTNGRPVHAQDPTTGDIVDGGYYHYGLGSSDPTDPPNCTINGYVWEQVYTMSSTCPNPPVVPSRGSVSGKSVQHGPDALGPDPSGFSSWIFDTIGIPRSIQLSGSCVQVDGQILNWTDGTRSVRLTGNSPNRITIQLTNGVVVTTTSFGITVQTTAGY